MTFEATFFGPGNRLRWEAIKAGSLPRDVQDRLGPFLADLQRNPDVLVLPRALDSGRVQWYVLCASPRATRMARDEVRAFLGPTYSDFEGRVTRLDPADTVEAAVLDRYGNNAFRLDVPERDLVDTARERLRLLMRLRNERPTRHARRLRAVGRVLRDFEYALLTVDAHAAGNLIDELRSSGYLSATNLLFLEVRRLAASTHWDAVLSLPELDSLLAMSRPRRVTEALINAVYESRLREFEEGNRASEAVQRFRSEIFPRYQTLYRSRATLSGFKVDASFLFAAGASTPARPEVAGEILANYPPDSRERAYLTAVAELSSRGTPPPAAVSTLDEARAAFAEADIDRAYELAVSLPPVFDRSALLLRCARDIGTLSAAQVALKSIESLPQADRLRLNRNVTLRRIRESLEGLSARDAPSSTAHAVAVELPSTWAMWLRRLTALQPWSAAVAVAETAAREWNVHAFASDPSAVQEVAELLLHDRPEWGQAALRDALPYLLEFCLVHDTALRLKAIYESLFLILAVDDQLSLPQVAALVKVVDIRLRLGVTQNEYREAIRHLSAAIHAVATPSVAVLALEAIEIVINSACPVPSERQELVATIAAVFQRWYLRIDKASFLLLQHLADELGVADVLPRPVSEGDAHVQSEWDALNGKKVAMYSLQESALRRAASVLGELCPGVRVDMFHDHVGGSSALRTAAATADVFLVATAAAKHAATTFIEAHRPSALATLYARGQGSSSLLDALREYLRPKTRA